MAKRDMDNICNILDTDVPGVLCWVKPMKSEAEEYAWYPVGLYDYFPSIDFIIIQIFRYYSTNILFNFNNYFCKFDSILFVVLL